jgi:hypothetical protein
MNDESNVWHSRLCHVNFGCMMHLASLSLIPKFTSVRNFKCHVCVESKQTRKPHKTAEVRNLAPLELVHSDLSEMNSALMLTVKIRQPSHEFTFGVGMTFVSYSLVLTPVV